MKISIYILSFFILFNLYSNESETTKTGTTRPTSIGVKASSADNRFKTKNITRTGAVKQAKTWQPKSKPSKPEPIKRSGLPVSKNPKIYIKSTILDLRINWLDNNGKITDTTEIPKNSQTGLKVPDNISYFDIRNSTETLKSDKIKIVDNIIYNVDCASFSKNKNCLKLQIESFKKVIKKSPSKDSEKEIPSKNSVKDKFISLINKTNGALEIVWLTSAGKQISKNKILTMYHQRYKIPTKAVKFKLIRGGGSWTSKAISIANNSEYEINCLPNNHYCNEISIKKIN